MSPLRQDCFSYPSDVNRDPNQLRLLAALLAQPEDDALDALRDMLPDAPWLAPAIGELQDMPLEHWQAEHTRLFVSGFPKTPCPPFESAYRQGQMGGTAAGDLAALYRRAGLHATEAPADYLGTLLECAAYLATEPLCPRDPAGRGEGDTPGLLREIWDDHLMRWVPRFADDLMRQSRIELYRLLGAQLARVFPHAVGHD